jgi:protein-S-isoprenylcysteine O-methyltransferase Ste14
VKHDSEQRVSIGQPLADAANVGLIRAPFVYLGSIGLGLLVHFFWPVVLLPASVSVPIGVMVVLVAGILFTSAVRTLRKAGAPIPSNRPTTTIVRAGPYGYSRKIYLAFTLLQVGLAAWVNSLGMLLALVPALTVLRLVVIPREERYLEARFPYAYLPYKREVRRWLWTEPAAARSTSNGSASTLTASVGAIVLTVIHHLYGATLYDAPFRQHVAFGIPPVLLVLALAYWVHRRHPLTSLGSVSLWVFMAVTLIVPVGMIGLIEGGYNHLVKNVLYFGGASRTTLGRLFPPPAYEMPNDLWFEVTGILQFFVGLYAGYCLVRLWRESRS